MLRPTGFFARQNSSKGGALRLMPCRHFWGQREFSRQIYCTVGKIFDDGISIGKKAYYDVFRLSVLRQTFLH
jgi:hypothetical protein